MNFEVGEKRARVAACARSRERARVRGAGALSRRSSPEAGPAGGAAGRVRGGSGPACIAGESYAPRPAPRVPTTQFRWGFFLLLLLNLLAPSLLHSPPHSPPTFQASLMSPEEWKVAER